MRRMLLAGLLAAAPLVTAHEADKDLDLGHWYVEGSLTKADLKDSEGSIESQSGSCGNLLNIFPGPFGCSNGVPNTVVFFPNNTGPGLPQDFKSEYETGSGYEVSVGYDFPGIVRLEVNYAQFDNDIDVINSQSVETNFDTTQLMGNVWMDFNEAGVVQPYIGLGLGASKLELADTDDTVLTAQAGLGLNFALGSHVKINLGYRYFESKDPVFEDNAGTSLRHDNSGQRLLLGVRYDFLQDPPIPPDTDGDGVPDSADRCPQTPRESKVDGFGCPLDSDRDGVYDYLDQCPDTPRGVVVDEKGCDLDDDKDGVANSADKCPQTPAGKRVLSNGCQSVVLQGVTFASGSAELTANAKQVCMDMARVMNSPAASDLIVELQGHTDSQGADTVNLKLSQIRAEAMRSCMIQNGVAASRLRAKGYGEFQPIASNGSAEGRARNRRTEMKILNN